MARHSRSEHVMLATPVIPVETVMAWTVIVVDSVSKQAGWGDKGRSARPAALGPRPPARSPTYGALAATTGPHERQHLPRRHRHRKPVQHRPIGDFTTSTPTVEWRSKPEVIPYL